MAPIPVLRNAAPVCLLSALPLFAQVGLRPDPVPLRNWPTPQRWQISPEEARNKGEETGRQAANAGGNAATTAPLDFVAMTPCRLVDTRVSATMPAGFGAASMAPGETRTFDVRSPNSPCPMPSNAVAYSANVTVVAPGPLGFLVVYPSGPRPLAATLNAPNGGIVNNSIAVAGGPTGSIDVFSTDATELIVDLNGYYVTAAAGLPGPTGGHSSIGQKLHAKD